MHVPGTTSLFKDLIAHRAPPAACEWLDRASGMGPGDLGVREAYPVAARRLGKAALDPTAEERARLAAAGVGWPIGGWGLDELGRVTLLLAAAGRLPAAALESLVAECYRQGDNRERQAVLRALPLLPAPERFLEIGVDACRSSIQPVFDAIACENPYPAAHFPEPGFNQMVLKALFTGVALERIVGLDGRITPELRRMANDYASERRAAGRSLPPDIGRLTGATGSTR